MYHWVLQSSPPAFFRAPSGRRKSASVLRGSGLWVNTRLMFSVGVPGSCLATSFVASLEVSAGLTLKRRFYLKLLMKDFYLFILDLSLDFIYVVLSISYLCILYIEYMTLY